MRIDKKDFVKAKMHHPLSPGEALKMLRELQELNQSDLAKLTNINQSNISAIENGCSQLGRDRALLLAHALKVHPSVILFPDFDIADVVIVVSTDKKFLATSEGQKSARTSPFFEKRLDLIKNKIDRVKKAIGDKNFSEFGELIEKEAL